MNKKTTDIISYITIVGLIVAFVAGDRRESKFHLNQALVVWLTFIVWSIINAIVSAVLFFPITVIWNIIAWIVNVLLIILVILGIVHAVQGEEKPLPIIGAITIYK